MGQAEGKAHRVLLIPFAPGIGDVVMMEPIIRALRTHRPEWHLTLVARRYASDLLQLDSYQLASPFYFVSEAPAAIRPLHKLLPQRLLAWAAEPAINIDLGPFDRVINLFWVWESSVPFDRWWMPQWPMQSGTQHALDLMADYIERELGIEIPEAERAPHLEPAPDSVVWVETLLESHGLLGYPLATMVVSAENHLKWWDIQKWAELNDWLLRMGWRTIIIAPQEQQHAQQVYDACLQKPLWPTLELRQLVALLARSDIVIGIDTGPLHLAGALGRPWVGLFGPSNPDLIGPYDRSKGRTIVARLEKPPSCKDCWLSFKGWGGNCTTLAATGCTTLIPVMEVTEAILSACCGTPFASPGDPNDE
ncbi:MAG: glycosyltransferase family 9 protein [Chloroflexota bacterium]